MATASYGRPAGLRSGAAPRLGRRSLFVAMVARMRGAWLDRELAAGVEPWRTAVHSTRSLQITSMRARRSLASSLQKLVWRAQTPPSPTWSAALSAAVPLDRRAVLGAQAKLEELADRLVDGTPVSTSGVAALRDLMSDGAGPLYSPLSGNSLGHVLTAIRLSLDVPD